MKIRDSGDSFDEKVISVFARVLKIAQEELSEQTSRRNLETWDSLSHMLLVEALGKEFEISISAEHALEINTVGDAKRIIADLINHC